MMGRGQNNQDTGGFTTVLGHGRGRGSKPRTAFSATGLIEQPLEPGERFMAVGVSYCQTELENILKKGTSGQAHWTARLLPETDNRFDPNAVSVEIAGMVVGHLKREQARAWQPLLLKMAQQGQLATCSARIESAVRRSDNQELLIVRLDALRPKE